MLAHGELHMGHQVFETIPSNLIVRRYRSRYGVDTARFFPSEELQLQRVQPHGYYKFGPVNAGDAQFYTELMNRRGYDSGDKAEFVEAAKEIPKSARVLDIGCGEGRFSKYCPGDYKGIELNPAAVKAAEGRGAAVYLERLEDQPAQWADVVTMFQVLEHVTDPDAFFQSAARCVKPSGKIIFSTPNADGLVGHAVNQELNYPPHHLTWWSADALVSLATASGFAVKRVWFEPLQRVHLRLLIQSLIAPRRRDHFESSARFQLARVAGRVMDALVPIRFSEFPWIAGHTVLVVAERS